MIFPRLDTSQRNSLRDGTTQSSTLRSGAIIYNTDSNRLELWTGGGWVDCNSSIVKLLTIIHTFGMVVGEVI